MMQRSSVEVLYMLSVGGSWLYSMMACFILHQNLLGIFLRVCKPLQSLPPQSVYVMGARFIAEAVLPVHADVCLLSTCLVVQEVCCCCCWWGCCWCRCIRVRYLQIHAGRWRHSRPCTSMASSTGRGGSNTEGLKACIRKMLLLSYKQTHMCMCTGQGN
jgi:hypothetical protein